jgi:hypothetical protein
MKHYGFKLVIAPVLVSCALAVFAQTAPPPSQVDALQEKLQQMQQANARNEEQLHTYQWIEATTLTTDGKSLPPRQSMCRYAVDGTILKTPLRPQEAQSGRRGGPLRTLIAGDKKKSIQEDMEQVRALTQLYLPFNKAKFKDALESGKVALNHDSPDGNIVVLSDYAKPGDQLRLTLNRTHDADRSGFSKDLLRQTQGRNDHDRSLRNSAWRHVVPGAQLDRGSFEETDDLNRKF